MFLRIHTLACIRMQLPHTMESVKVGYAVADAETRWVLTVALFYGKIDGFSMIFVAVAENDAYSLSKVSSSDLTSVALRKL